MSMTLMNLGGTTCCYFDIITNSEKCTVERAVCPVPGPNVTIPAGCEKFNPCTNSNACDKTVCAHLSKCGGSGGSGDCGSRAAAGGANPGPSRPSAGGPPPPPAGGPGGGPPPPPSILLLII